MALVVQYEGHVTHIAAKRRRNRNLLIRPDRGEQFYELGTKRRRFVVRVGLLELRPVLPVGFGKLLGGNDSDVVDGERHGSAAGR